jgi:hypothetical protein
MNVFFHKCSTHQSIIMGYAKASGCSVEDFCGDSHGRRRLATVVTPPKTWRMDGRGPSSSKIIFIIIYEFEESRNHPFAKVFQSMQVRPADSTKSCRNKHFLDILGGRRHDEPGHHGARVISPPQVRRHRSAGELLTDRPTVTRHWFAPLSPGMRRQSSVKPRPILRG